MQDGAALKCAPQRSIWDRQERIGKLVLDSFEQLSYGFPRLLGAGPCGLRQGPLSKGENHGCHFGSFCRRCGAPWTVRRSRFFMRPGAPKRARQVRLLHAGPVLVAILLRRQRGAPSGRVGTEGRPAMRGAASFLCGPWPVAAIRERVPGILRSAGAATQPYHRLVHDRPDAVVQPDLS